MSYVVKILRLAEQDMARGALWYEKEVPGLGEEFLNEVTKACEALKENAGIYRIRFARTRRAPVPRFGFYGVYYKIIGTEVHVIAVHHGRRHPLWIRRRSREV